MVLVGFLFLTNRIWVISDISAVRIAWLLESPVMSRSVVRQQGEHVAHQVRGESHASPPYPKIPHHTERFLAQSPLRLSMSYRGLLAQQYSM